MLNNALTRKKKQQNVRGIASSFLSGTRLSAVKFMAHHLLFRAGCIMEIELAEGRRRSMNYQRLQVWVLRLVGAVELLAFGAVVMPRAWMEATQSWMGLPSTPKGPVFDSVMRQVSFTYGLHGVGLLIIAADVVRYRPLVILTGIGYLLAAPVFFLVDLHNGMPWMWIAGNGGSCLLIGTLVIGLLWAERAKKQ
jgi:hypothetical protein